MRLSSFTSVGATLLFVATANAEPSYADTVRSLQGGKGVRMLGRDGVLRRLNDARDAVVDHVQLSPDHIAEYTKRFPAEARALWAGVDGRAVTAEEQLWAVPEDVPPRNPRAVSKKETSPLEKRIDCTKYPCETSSECVDEYPPCQECDVYSYDCYASGCNRVLRCMNTI